MTIFCGQRFPLIDVEGGRALIQKDNKVYQLDINLNWNLFIFLLYCRCCGLFFYISIKTHNILNIFIIIADVKVDLDLRKIPADVIELAIIIMFVTLKPFCIYTLFTCLIESCIVLDTELVMCFFS